MDFLTSRLNDSLENNKTSLSARSPSSTSCLSSRLSSRSYDTSITSVRHVNTAAFFENLGLENDEKFETMSEIQSDIVPPLDIKSEDNYPTTRDYTFSYRNHCEADKNALKPDKAFETWLSAKRKRLFDEAAKRKKEEEVKQTKIEERKRLAREKYDNWLQQKSQSSTKVPSHISNSTIQTNTNCEIRKHSNLSAEEARANLQSWEKAKRVEQQRRRMLKQQEDKRRCDLEEQRRQMAAEAWESWVSNSNKKPKPVPLNRGIFTLRGTVSEIFVNPNEWKSIIPLKKEEN